MRNPTNRPTFSRMTDLLCFGRQNAEIQIAPDEKTRRDATG
jgi:hypothetical protein